MIAPGSLVLDGRFRVLQLLGTGGMGEVYLGEQVSLGRKVAIKALHPDLLLQPGMTERFKREARLLSAVEHPAVVRVIDYGETERGACLVMEYVEGENLFDVLQAGAMAPVRALPLLYQLAEGLAAIHERGIIHRDLKPENVLLTKGPRGEQAKLLDFGIARLVEPDAASNLSMVGLVVGTPEYLSPEQAVGAKVDARSDLYSFGVLAYRVLSGRLPFLGPGPSQFVAQHAGAAPLPLIEAAPTLLGHPELVSLVMQLLRKEPEQRLPDALALVDALGATAARAQGVASFTALGTAVTAPVLAAGGITSFNVPVPTSAHPVSAPPVPEPVAAPPSWSTPLPLQPVPATPSGTGTSVFGASPPPSPALVRNDTAFAPTRLSGSAPSVGGGTLAGKPQNLTVMSVLLRGFTERSSRQTHEKNARMLETRDGLLLPLVREYGGRLVQKGGDQLLAVFPSPTHSVLCGMAMQDRLWRHDQRRGPEECLPVSISLHTGEVLVSRDAVLGEPVEVVKVVEALTPAGEVTFTESVNLARNRVEGDAEPRGTVPMPGSGQPLQLYHCSRAAEGPPFGGQDEVRLRPALTTQLTEQLLPVVEPVQAAWQRVLPAVKEAWRRGVELARAYPRRAAGVGLGLVAALGLTTWQVAREEDPVAQAWELVEEGQPEEALKRLEEVPKEEAKGVAARQARAAALHGLERHEEERTLLAELDEEARVAVEDRVLGRLAEDFGEDEGDRGLRKLLASFPKERLQAHFRELADAAHSPRQWGALRYLEVAQATEGLNLVKLYLAALESTDCSTRGRAAKRLGALGDKDAKPALEQLRKLPRDKTGPGAKNCGQEEAADALRALAKKSN